MPNNKRRKGKGSNSRPVSFSANSNCTTETLIKAIRAKKFTRSAEILEKSGIVGDYALLIIGHLGLIVRGGL